MLKKPLSRTSVGLVVLLAAGAGLLGYAATGDEHDPRSGAVAAADRRAELAERNRSVAPLPGREPLGGVSSDAGWIDLADEARLAPLESGRVWMQQLDVADAELLPIELREPLPPERMAASRILAWVPGYVPYSGRLTPHAGANVLLMKRAGSVEIRIVDSAGRPLEDCEVGLFLDEGVEPWLAERKTLFPEVRGDPRALRADELIDTPRGWVQSNEAVGRLGAPKVFELRAWDSPVRRTTVDGVATWSDIPALEGYRWYLATPLHVEVEPPHEHMRLQEVADAVLTSIAPPPGLSGRFEVAAGEIVRLTGTLLAPARVHGRVDCPSARRPAVVKLYSVDRAGGSTAPETVAFDEASSQRSGPDGRFEFADVRPGIHAVRAWWEEEERDYFFTCATFRLEPGADLDLGVLRALQGASLEVAIGITDQSGVPQAPEMVFSAPGDRLDAHLSITAVPDSGLATHMVHGYFPVPFGELFRIHGLQPGRAYVGAEPSPGLVIDPTRVGALAGAPPVRVEVGSTDFLYLELTATMGTARPLRLRNERGDEILAPAIWVRDLQSGRVSTMRPHRLGTAPADAPRAVNLPAGSYELLCKLTTGDSPHGLAARASVSFDGMDRSQIELDARPAVSVSGVLRDSSGAVIPDQHLIWALEGWPLDPDNAVFGATTDSEGVFVLSEIPAHTALRGSRAGCDLPPLAPGEHEGLVLTTTP
jgi:hypothetical protein